MQFGNIDHIILFGGSRCTAELARAIKNGGRWTFAVYTSDRQLDDVIHKDGRTFGDVLQAEGITAVSTPDINSVAGLREQITPTTLGIGLGEPWSFNADLISLFDGRLLDLMGIRLPQYRGGAHYTWQILRKNRIGCCNLQVINEDMVQGVFDSGEIVKSREYLYPASVRIPLDYFDYAVGQEIDFVTEFLDEVAAGKAFEPFRLQENFSLYFPRLYTNRHGLIDWRWNTGDLETFICAFDDPYAGASTRLNGRRVHLKKARAEYNDGPFHPFQVGMVHKIYGGAVYISTRQGSIIVERVLDENGNDVMDSVGQGMRFFTPQAELEDALSFNAEYGADGLD